MIISENIGMQGRFKLDVYNKDNSLKYTTDYFNNFITSGGLDYVKTYAFADCFRYLSLGVGTANNNTTPQNFGLQTSTKYTFLGGNPYCQGISAGNNYLSNGCGFKVTNNVVSLSRAWRVPIDESKFFEESVNFEEYILSPGRDYARELDTDLVPQKVCGCASYFKNQYYEDTIGFESQDIAAYYPTICDSTGAFTRILKSIPVAPTEYLVVNYSLDLTFQSEPNKFKIGIQNKGSYGDANNWKDGSFLTGFSSVIHPGIKLISNGQIGAVNNMDQIEFHTFRVGESFNPPLGIAMEPHLAASFRTAYISNDNLQFVVNSRSGGAITADFQPYFTNGYKMVSGVRMFLSDWINLTSSNVNGGTYGDESLKAAFVKPRSEKTSTFPTPYPSPSDFTTSDISTVFKDYDKDFNLVDFTPITLEKNLVSDDFVANVGGSRKRSKAISFQFKDTSSKAQNFPVRAMVYGYVYDDGYTKTIFPAMDSIFGPVSTTGPIVPITGNPFSIAKTLAPATQLGMYSPTNTTGYYYMDTTNHLQVVVKLNWSSPCPNGVDGCP